MKDQWGREVAEPNPWFSGNTWRGFILVAVLLMVILPIFAIGLSEVLPSSWSDSESCYENEDQDKCYYETSPLDQTGR